MKVAAIQMNTKADKQENLQKAERFITKAAEDGAIFISLPEYFNFMGPDTEKVQNAEEIPGGETYQLLSSLAKKHGVYIHAGSILEKYSDEKAYNTGFVVSPEGDVVAKYNKLHLFDIEINGMPAYKESNTIQAGESSATVELPFGKAGLSICYDLRFPELYREYALDGCNVLCIPAAFTQYTGMLAWEVLQRARAIENQCYVIAAGQFGSHAPGKACYGNSMIIDPWGTVIARAPEGEGVIVAEIDPSTVKQARESVPCLTHRRPELYKVK
ncbi:carbon-nitrogen hydrolase family protein [Bacillus carboniphilus]|uniref:Carbon-nitrogen hydrolase family protein n=1 Tax=Bacillus carboniphilus TaxID=86663 RepID=A0ABN0VUY0_9BACI